MPQQTMETAPRDGTKFLADDSYGEMLVKWDNKKKRFVMAMGLALAVSPIVWNSE